MDQGLQEPKPNITQTQTSVFVRTLVHNNPNVHLFVTSTLKPSLNWQTAVWRCVREWSKCPHSVRSVTQAHKDRSTHMHTHLVLVLSHTSDRTLQIDNHKYQIFVHITGGGDLTWGYGLFSICPHTHHSSNLVEEMNLLVTHVFWVLHCMAHL